MDGQAAIEIERPRSAPALIGAAFGLYRLFPWLFVALAAVVVLPYSLVDLLATFGLHGTANSLVSFPLTVADLALVLPLVTAFHVFAVDDVRLGRRPTFGSVSRRGLAKLRTVSAATVVSWLGIVGGLVLLVVPGVILWLRWIVAAQVAAIQAEDWEGALAGSNLLTRDHYRHALGFLLLVFAITLVPGAATWVVFGFHPRLVSSLVRVPFDVLTSSFTALTGALLYFDLRSRRAASYPAGVGTSDMTDRPTGHPLDPASYDDANRPHGWYVDPTEPSRMRYWPGNGPQGWSGRRARTPKKTLAEWRAYEAGEPPRHRVPTPSPVTAPAATPGRPPAGPTGHPLDPDSYTDEERAPGWYVVPEQPWKMRHWSGGDPATGWSERTAKTPKEVLAGWWRISDR